ncbi:hypothetical protein [Azonexus hydrophilus]|uniref:Uncharacterized protein n=1 Tax=Azonexus hydrophilus TaxID=418702 RepID=A0ABZ2XBG4_9RHOO
MRLQLAPLVLSKNGPVFRDGTGTASKTDRQTGGNTMLANNQSQTTSKSQGRDAAIQITCNSEDQPAA